MASCREGRFQHVVVRELNLRPRNVLQNLALATPRAFGVPFKIQLLACEREVKVDPHFLLYLHIVTYKNDCEPHLKQNLTSHIIYEKILMN